MQFKTRLSFIMAADFIGCWLVEIVCKALFADLAPKQLITRGRERRELRRHEEERRNAQLVDEESKKSQ